MLTDLGKLEQILSDHELARVQKTVLNFLQNPDYATGEEQGRSFERLSVGETLPLEIVLRDWNTRLNNGRGGRQRNKGDCYSIYKVLYEDGRIEGMA